MHQYHTEFST